MTKAADVYSFAMLLLEMWGSSESYAANNHQGVSHPADPPRMWICEAVDNNAAFSPHLTMVIVQALAPDCKHGSLPEHSAA